MLQEIDFLDEVEEQRECEESTRSMVEEREYGSFGPSKSINCGIGVQHLKCTSSTFWITLSQHFYYTISTIVYFNMLLYS